jgi:hypothetical protein
MVGKPKIYTEQMFWDKVDIKQQNDCWEFQGGRQHLYGIYRCEGKTWKAHRYAYTITYGDIPKGKVVMHHCDNPGCVNPMHLELGTQKENIADMMRKGRQNRNIRKRNKIFSPEQVRDIRNSEMNGLQLSRKYGVRPQTIYDILHRRTFTNIY